MNRIPLTKEQRAALHALRKTTETAIKELKKLLRGVPHTVASAGHQMALRDRKTEANTIYTLLAGARGREHSKQVEKTLSKLREQARYYNTYQKTRRAPAGTEPMALMLVEAESATQAPAAAAAPAPAA